METVATIFAIVGSAVAGVWALRSKLSDLEKALAIHTIEDKTAHEQQDQIEARVLKLERKRR